MIKEEFSQLTEIATNNKETKVRDFVFSQDQRFNRVELLYSLEIFVSKIALWEVDLLCMSVDNDIF